MEQEIDYGEGAGSRPHWPGGRRCGAGGRNALLHAVLGLRESTGGQRPSTICPGLGSAERRAAPAVGTAGIRIWPSSVPRHRHDGHDQPRLVTLSAPDSDRLQASDFAIE